MTGRELFGLLRLAAIEKLHLRAAEVLRSDDRAASRAVVNDLLKLAHQNPQLARARVTLQSHADDIIDGADMIKLAERELMAPLDQEARRLVSLAAQRVSVVTAVSPRAVIDVLFVFVAALRMIRQLARLYGGRPGALGMISLMRQVIGHLAITGGMAATRQPGAADARPRHRGEAVAPARRGRAQWVADGAAWAGRDRSDTAAAVHGAAAAGAGGSGQGFVEQAGGRKVSSFLSPRPLWGGWHVASAANNMTGGGSARQCAEMPCFTQLCSVGRCIFHFSRTAVRYPHTALRATLPTRGRDWTAAAATSSRISPASTRHLNSGESGGGYSSGVQPVIFSSA